MSLVKRIETLRNRHSELDAILHDEEHRPLPDISRVHRFKREKLKIKDEITRLSSFVPYNQEAQRRSA
ncbi:MAG: DUF465 domain-containing protein [Alphaproteobacteria bacterium]|nr:DUF465 domain-containing protein [Alphaproteobacteria bacterium]